jgi:hypothetical protein
VYPEFEFAGLNASFRERPWSSGNGSPFESTSVLPSALVFSSFLNALDIVVGLRSRCHRRSPDT